MRPQVRTLRRPQPIRFGWLLTRRIRREIPTGNAGTVVRFALHSNAVTGAGEEETS